MPPEAGAIRAGPILVIPDLLREFGVDPQPLFKTVGLPLSSLGDPDMSIPFKQVGELLSACARETACPHFGLLVGQRNGIGSLGLIGFLAQNLPDAGSALREMIRHVSLHDRGATVGLTVSGGTATLRYEIDKASSTGAREVSDGALALLRNILLSLCGRGQKPLRVEFRHARPIDARPYQSFFQAPLVFGAAQNALVFSASCLDSVVPQADPKLRQYLADNVDEMTQQIQLDFQEKAFQGILKQVRAGHSSLDGLASQFAMHRRTLNRRLQASGTSFRQMENKARHEIACELLRDTPRSADAIATELGYTSASAFSRAFSKWEGQPPTAWRKLASTSSS
jgi:AraC-like DNA-binding protein